MFSYRHSCATAFYRYFFLSYRFDPIVFVNHLFYLIAWSYHFSRSIIIYLLIMLSKQKEVKKKKGKIHSSLTIDDDRGSERKSNNKREEAMKKVLLSYAY